MERASCCLRDPRKLPPPKRARPAAATYCCCYYGVGSHRRLRIVAHESKAATASVQRVAVGAAFSEGHVGQLCRRAHTKEHTCPQKFSERTRREKRRGRGAAAGFALTKVMLVRVCRSACVLDVPLPLAHSGCIRALMTILDEHGTALQMDISEIGHARAAPFDTGKEMFPVLTVALINSAHFVRL